MSIRKKLERSLDWVFSGGLIYKITPSTVSCAQNIPERGEQLPDKIQRTLEAAGFEIEARNDEFFTFSRIPALLDWIPGLWEKFRAILRIENNIPVIYGRFVPVQHKYLYPIFLMIFSFVIVVMPLTTIYMFISGKHLSLIDIAIAFLGPVMFVPAGILLMRGAFFIMRAGSDPVRLRFIATLQVALQRYHEALENEKPQRRHDHD